MEPEEDELEAQLAALAAAQLPEIRDPFELSHYGGDLFQILAAKTSESGEAVSLFA